MCIRDRIKDYRRKWIQHINRIEESRIPWRKITTLEAGEKLKVGRPGNRPLKPKIVKKVMMMMMIMLTLAYGSEECHKDVSKSQSKKTKFLSFLTGCVNLDMIKSALKSFQ